MINIEVPGYLQDSPSLKDKVTVLAWALACRSKGVKFEVTQRLSGAAPVMRMRSSSTVVYGLQPVLEMIEERFGDPALMPVDIQERWATRARMLAMINAMQPDEQNGGRWVRQLGMVRAPGELFVSGKSFTLADCVAFAMLAVGSTPEEREQVAWCKEYFNRLSTVPAVMQAVALCRMNDK